MPTGIYKRIKTWKHSEETKQKMRLAALGRPRQPHSEETKRKISLGHLGMKHTEETKKKFLGIHKDEKSGMWKGKNVGMRSLHLWVERRLGKPHFCEKCGNRNLDHRQYNWANVSHKYKRILSDWRRLCCSCHKRYDWHYKKYKKNDYI